MMIKWVKDKAEGIRVLAAVLKRLRWDDQGGYPGYRGNGKWDFISAGLPQVTPAELNTLMALAGVVPDKIIPKGSCSTCLHSKNGQEQGYMSRHCMPCKRPQMSHWQPKG